MYIIYILAPLGPYWPILPNIYSIYIYMRIKVRWWCPPAHTEDLHLSDGGEEYLHLARCTAFAPQMSLQEGLWNASDKCIGCSTSVCVQRRLKGVAQANICG